jgi:peptide/nickel transport system substrate-binding protein
VLKRAGNLATRILDPRGYTCMLRVNHLQPPFDNPAIRRALLGAIDQFAFMTAVAGDDPAYQAAPIGFFAPGTPMASDVGLDVFRGSRDMAKVKADLKAAGYNGEKVVLLVPTNSLAQKPLGDVAADMLQQAGMNVEYAGMDFGAVLQRQLKKDPIAQGGWSAGVGNWQGIDWLNPAGNTNLRGDSKAAGWYRSEKMGALRSQWLAASSLAEQQRICRDIQALSFEEIPYFPIGQYKQPTAYRIGITGILDGTAVFWNVRPS